MKYSVTREIPFCYGHRLVNYRGKCENLHGHNGRAIVKIEADELDHQGMVVDFVEIKQTIANWINDNLDHKLLMFSEDPLLPVLQEHNEKVFVMECNPTAENIARLIFERAKSEGLAVTEVTVWETENCYATVTCTDSSVPGPRPQTAIANSRA